MTSKIRITIWSDYVCPFCYLEEPVLERVRQEYGKAVELVWRAFELRPEPIPTLEPDGEYLHRVWNQVVYPMARECNMTLKLPPVQPRSRRALEMAEFAREKGCFEKAHRALFRAFFEDGRDLDNIDILVQIGAGTGLNGNDLRAALKQETYRERVIQDQQQAATLGVTSVLTAMIGLADQSLIDAEVISGAQPFDVVQTAVERTLDRQT